MTRTEQIEFVMQLSSNVVGEILVKIANGDVPEEWDGIELRRYLRDKFDDAVIGSIAPKRKRAYENALIVNNL